MSVALPGGANQSVKPSCSSGLKNKVTRDKEPYFKKRLRLVFFHSLTHLKRNEVKIPRSYTKCSQGLPEVLSESLFSLLVVLPGGVKKCET